MRYWIYLISCKNNLIKHCYVGRTSKDPIFRFRNHITQAKHHSDKFLYNTINENGGIENFQFTILEDCDTADPYLCREREQYFVSILKPSLNIYEPNRDLKKYRNDNRISYNEYMRNYMKIRNLLKKELLYFNF